MMILLHLSAAICYGAAWRFGRMFWLAASLHALTIILPQEGGAYLGIGEWLSFFMLMTALLSWQRTRPLSRGIILCGAAAAVLLPLLLPAPSTETPPVIFAHGLLAMLAYTFAAIALLQWLDLRQAERARRRLQADSAPPILTMEEDCFRSLGWAFALLSLTLISGITFALADSATNLPGHKMLFAALSWLTFGGLLLGRKFLGWRGHAAQTWLATGFIFLLLSYFGTYFVLQVLLER